MKTFVVYRHIRPDKDEPFYIGIGTMRRAYTFHRDRNKHWTNVYNLNEGNIEVDILIEDITWEQACIKEQEFIKLYGRKDKGFGTLVNMTDGGEGAYGREKSKESIDKFKKTMSGREHPMKGRTHTPEARKRIGAGASKKVWTHDAIEKIKEKNRKRKRTPEEIEKSASKRRGRKWTEKQKENLRCIREEKGYYTPTIEMRAQISAKLKGHHVSEKTRKAVSESNKLREMSEETREKRRLTMLGKNQERKHVLNTETGIEYISAQQALKSSGYTYSRFYRRLSGKVVDNEFKYKYICRS